MSDVASALRELAEPWKPGDRVKVLIDRAAKRSGLGYWRVFDLWYRKARRVEQFEIDAIREALIEKRKRDAANEYQELRARLAKLEAALVRADADFFSPTINFVREQVRKSGGEDSALD